MNADFGLDELVTRFRACVSGSQQMSPITVNSALTARVLPHHCSCVSSELDRACALSTLFHPQLCPLPDRALLGFCVCLSESSSRSTVRVSASPTS
eukprot:791052-Rhodomonas_salina.1